VDAPSFDRLACSVASAHSRRRLLAGLAGGLLALGGRVAGGCQPAASDAACAGNCCGGACCPTGCSCFPGEEANTLHCVHSPGNIACQTDEACGPGGNCDEELFVCRCGTFGGSCPADSVCRFGGICARRC
jgi:hypothetical protein